MSTRIPGQRPASLAEHLCQPKDPRWASPHPFDCCTGCIPSTLSFLYIILPSRKPLVSILSRKPLETGQARMINILHDGFGFHQIELGVAREQNCLQKAMQDVWLLIPAPVSRRRRAISKPRHPSTASAQHRQQRVEDNEIRVNLECSAIEVSMLNQTTTSTRSRFS